MKRDQLGNVAAFVAVAQQRSFTRAALRLGMSRSGLSHAIANLEYRLGVRLFSRTTRNVFLTEAGERWLQIVQPALADIEAGFTAMTALRSAPVGKLRIRVYREGMRDVLAPILDEFIGQFSEINVEIVIDTGLSGLIGEGFDAGIAIGSMVPNDVVAFQISPDTPATVVGSPGYFERYGVPESPHDLARHNCGRFLTVDGSVYSWEFNKNGRNSRVKVNGNLTVNEGELFLIPALAGRILAYGFRDMYESHIASGELIEVLTDWCPMIPGFFFYYPSKRLLTPAMKRVIATLERSKG